MTSYPDALSHITFTLKHCHDLLYKRALSSRPVMVIPKDYRVLKYRMPRQPQIPLSLQMTYLQLSKCNETCRTAKMGPPESVQTISSQHAHDIGEISNFIWLPITAVREFCVPTRALCAHIFKFPGKVSAWLAWCGHTELSAWLAWSDSKFANIFSVCWLNTKNIFCTPWGGQILPILQFSLWHEHSRYVIWTESGFEAWWDLRGNTLKNHSSFKLVMVIP